MYTCCSSSSTFPLWRQRRNQHLNHEGANTRPEPLNCACLLQHETPATGEACHVVQGTSRTTNARQGNKPVPKSQPSSSPSTGTPRGLVSAAQQELRKVVIPQRNALERRCCCQRLPWHGHAYPRLTHIMAVETKVSRPRRPRNASFWARHVSQTRAHDDHAIVCSWTLPPGLQCTKKSSKPRAVFRAARH